MVFVPESFDGLTGFQWDSGNSGKCAAKHDVSPTESEQVFFNRPLPVASGDKHSQTERRHFALGRTDQGRLLPLVFTIRGDLIRVISARPMSRVELGRCEQAEEN
jgi:uncharacterized DUF497 family protein